GERVVDEDVDAAVAIDGGGDQALAVLGPGDVDDHRVRGGAGGGRLGGDALAGRLGAPAQHQVSALARERQPDGAAEAGAGARAPAHEAAEEAGAHDASSASGTTRVRGSGWSAARTQRQHMVPRAWPQVSIQLGKRSRSGARCATTTRTEPSGSRRAAPLL